MLGAPVRRFGGWLALLVIGLLSAGPAHAQTARASAPAVSSQAAIGVVDARVATEAGRTSFALEFDAAPDPSVFLVAEPHRLVIDLANAAFRLPPTVGMSKSGLVAGFRFGLLAPGQSRLVADLTGPAKVEQADVVERGQGRTALVVVLSATDEATFRAAAGKGVALGGGRPAAAVTGSVEPSSEGRKAAGASRPRIVIDPGHGGLDPGAVGKNGVLEKTIVLEVARQLGTLLAARQRYQVVLTRTDDKFVALDRRVQISEQEGADLFISLHADSLESTEVASTVRGATIYTLSDKASDEQARRLAEKENSTDLLAGLGAANAEISDPVRDILFDLVRRETANFAAEFRNVLVGELRKTIEMSRDPTRAAAFRVLRQTQTPSVLVELGYMSNAQDQQLMTTPVWQYNVAKSIAAAIDRFFERRTRISGR